MASASWLDDDPYATRMIDTPPAAPPPAAGNDAWAASSASLDQAPQQTPAPSPDWSTSAPSTPQSQDSRGYVGDVNPQNVDPNAVRQGMDRGGVTGSASSGAADVARYTSYLDAMNGAKDPQSHATAQDALARQVQKDLEADGHKVTWKGTTLMVDGRPYELGGKALDAYTPGASGSFPNTPGWEESRLNNPTDTDPKTEFGRYVAAHGGHVTGDDVRAFVSSDPRWEIDPTSSPDDPRIRVKQTALDLWKPGQSIYQDVIKDSGPGGANVGMFENAGGPSGPGGGGGSPWLSTSSSGGANWLSQFGGGPGTNNSGYTPNPIDENLGLPNFDQLYQMASQSGATDQQTEALVQDILAHPESLSANDVEMLKAKNAEEAALAAQAQDQELQHFGYNAGLDSSPWLAGQRSDNAWKRRAATIEGNRTVDISAADRRAADRRSAASVGQSWSAFTSTKKQAALNFAVSSALQAAGEQRNRRSLNESLRQAATHLGLQKDELVLAYIKTNMGYDIDIKKLKQAGDQFQQDLLYRVNSLKQSDDEFKANYGLSAQEFQHRKDQDMWNRSRVDSGALSPAPSA